MTSATALSHQQPPFPLDVSWEDPDTVAAPCRREGYFPGQNIAKNNLADIHEFLCHELLVPKLNEIDTYLWIAGRRGNRHALHWHLMVKRSIIVTENSDMHLVCTDWAIFVKPLPVCLLDYNVHSQHIVLHDNLAAAARGFLLTYAHLVVHESDFLVAQQNGLLPRRMTWLAWCRLRTHLAKIPHATVNKRYNYGELRLSRLNLIYRISRGRLTYFQLHRSYSGYFFAQYKTSLILFAYVTVIHGAFQTMLNAEERFSGVEVMSKVSMWFGVVTVVMVLVSVIFQGIYLITVFLYNLQATLQQPERPKDA